MENASIDSPLTPNDMENGEPRVLMDSHAKRFALREITNRLSEVEERLQHVEYSLNACSKALPANGASTDGRDLTSLVLQAFAAGGNVGTTREFIRFWLEKTHHIEDRPKLRRDLNKLLKQLQDEGRVTSCGPILSLVAPVPMGDVRHLEDEADGQD